MFKKNECDHMWVEVSRTFNPPLEYKYVKQRGASDDMMKTMLYGITNIEHRCEHCNFPHIITVIGNVKAPK